MRKTVILIALCCATLAVAAQQKWEPLFNGKNFKGWTKKGGVAEYRIVDGAIEGISQSGTPNTFLCTDKEYGDFILEMSFKVDDGLNSGVQLRSHSYAACQNGRVHGYQYEIDPSPRAWSGGIYDEARQGWFCTLVKNPAAQKAFRNNDWNTMRVEALGNRIRTWINGVPAADLLDNQDASGFIALQVHQVGKDMDGKKVMWKDIRICTADVAQYLLPEDPSLPQYNAIPNTISEREAADGWKLLWNGRTTEGWRSARGPAFPEGGWRIENGELIVEAAGGAESTNGGDIITEKKYGNFILTVEFRLTPKANSGIKYFVNPDINNSREGSAIGCEFQILDDNLHPDAKLGVNGNRTLGGLYDLIPPLAEPKKAALRTNMSFFNKATIIVNGNHVEHWLNDVKLVEYDRNCQMWDALVAYSKYAGWIDFGNFATGHILLQDHGDEVRFKNVKIKEL